jgi:signal transduction histidine kinase/ActR/RegA family two-component response regulator
MGDSPYFLLRMPPASTPDFAYLPQDGEMVNLLRARDWSATSLGPPSTWPESLHLQLNVCFDSPFAIAVWWGPELIQFYNDGYRPILGATKHPEAFGRPARETWPDIWPTIGPMVEQVMDHGVAVKGDDMPLTLDRNGYLEPCNFTFSYSPIRDRDGVIHGMFTAAVETTARVAGERRQAFQLALADRLRGQSTAEEVVAAATDLARSHLLVKRAFFAEIDEDAATFSIPQHWMSSDLIDGLPAHGSTAPFASGLLHTLCNGEAVVAEHIRDDPRFPAAPEGYDALAIQAIVIVPLVRAGRLRAAFNVAHDAARRWSGEDIALIADVAERTWEALERARAEQALHASNRMKDEFLAMLAHELRNPLAPISAAADLLALARLDPDKVRSTSAIIRRQVAHMTGLVDDLLDVSRVTRGLVDLAREPIDVHDIVAAAVEQVRPLLQARHHELLVADAPGRAMVRGDRKRLVQVVANLLNNAAKYTAPWGRIMLRVGVQDDTVTISVTDNGMGMDHDLVDRAFELFAQGERNADRTQGGLGIGLALVKHLVELHGGTVTARSDGLGRGSAFTITLPASDTATAAAVAADRAGFGAHASASPLRVLLVDDNTDAATMLALILEAAGHAVAVEHTAQAALAYAARHPFDVCLLDIGLPDINGNELARRLRTLPGMQHVLLVAVTGYGQPADRQNSQQAGFDHHFVKPVDSAQLIALLAKRGAVRPATPAV